MNLYTYTHKIVSLSVALISVAFCSLASAQKFYSDVNVDNYTPNCELVVYGLVSKNVKCLVEDGDGYIWIGTQNGLVRYDGIDMLSFFTSDVVRPMQYGMSINAVHKIYYNEKDNDIYAIFLNKNQVAVIDLDTYEQRVLSYDDIDSVVKQSSTNKINSLCNYNDSLLLGLGNGDVYFINKWNGYMTYAYKGNDVKSWTASDVIEHNNMLYAIADSKLQIISPGHAAHELSVKSIKTNVEGRLKSVTQYTDSSALILSISHLGLRNYYLYEYVYDTQQTRFIYEGEGIPSDVIVDDGIVRIVTFSNLQILDVNSKRVYIYNTINSNIVDNGLVCGIRCKKQPIYWYGSSDGLIKENYYLSKLKVFDVRRISESTSCNVFTVYKDENDDIWSWCLDGIFRKKNGEYLMKHYDLGKLDQGKLFLTKILEDKVQRVLYFCYRGNVIMHNMDTDEDKLIVSSGSRDNSFIGAEILSDRRLMIVGSNCITFYNPRTRAITYDEQLYTEENNMAKNFVFDMEGDSIIWLCNNGDIAKYDMKTKKYATVINVLRKGIGVNAIRYTYRNGIRELWVASNREGLQYVLPDMGVSKHIDYSQYTLGNVSAVEIDQNNNVWIASNEGILCINNNNGATYEYGSDVYGFNTKFNKGSSAQTSNGEMFIGGQNVIVQVNTRNFDYNKYFPKPIVTTYRYVNATNYNYDHIIQRDNICVSDTIVVPKGIRSLIFNIHILNYDNSNRNKMAWRISSDDPWQEASASTPFVLSELSYGYNKIEFASITETGFPSKEVTTVWVKKEVYIYENPIFQGFVVILIIAMVYLAIYLHAQKVKRDKLILQQEVKEQAGMIMDANEKLKQSQLIIEQRNIELQKSHDDLELEVQQRTNELNQALQKAEENSKLKSAFLANLSHEVRTPMNCIVGFSKLLADPLCTRADQLEFSQLIQDSSKSLMTLISDLLDVSRIESGQLRVNFAEFDVSKALENVYKALIVERKYQDVAFELLTGDEVEGLVINSDSERFRQIIINITYNAFKFTKEGHVTISADVTTANQLRRKYFYPVSAPDVTTESKLLIVSIADTGIGVPSDKMDEIFEPFRKLSNNKTHYPGLGLGLNIVKNLVKLLNGEIWLTSELNKGTTFYFYLPV
ncbi:MAG: hypothetical protein J6Y72_09175 [Bacteroidales bacterium]|nr:hypothetical protein [Bacteroidales bacterium]